MQKRPTGIAKWLLHSLVGRESHYSCLGDLEELYNEIREKSGSIYAGLWFYWQLIWILSLRTKNSIHWSAVMFKNYLKIAVRNINKNRGYSFLNIMGLAVGIAVCILIFTYIVFELNFDRFHDNADDIYRLTLQASFAGQNLHTATSSAPAAAAITSDYPEVVNAARFYDAARVPVAYGNKTFIEEEMLYGDNSVFEIFTFPIINGDNKTPLVRPFTAVISEGIARKYFEDEDPVGKILKMNNISDYEITAVMKNIPPDSHIDFDILLSFETLYSKRKGQVEAWVPLNYHTYVLLQENYDHNLLNAKMPDFIQRYMGDLLKAIGGTGIYELQPFTDIHLHSHLESEMSANSSYYYIYIFAVTAVLILLLACINFMNLSTARSLSRAREIGIRKVMGSYKGNLIRQFLGEAVLYSVVSLVIALFIVKLSMPFFRTITGREIAFSYIEPVWLLPVFFLAAVGVGIIAGSYPAFFLSSFKPIEVLKNKIGRTGMSDIKIRNSLVVFQFVISIALIIGTLVIYQQLIFMKEERLGFNKENVLVIPLKGNIDRGSVPRIQEKIMQHNGISSVTFSSKALFGEQSGDIFIADGSADEHTIIMGNINTDHEFLETAQLELIDGRNFSPELISEENKAVLINETAARRFGMEDPVGKKIVHLTDTGPEGRHVKTVVGLVKDFHIQSMHSLIEPIVINFGLWDLNFMMVRIESGNPSDVFQYLEKCWEEIDPVHSFDYYFLDEAYDRQYRAEEKLVQIFTNFSLLGILIACLGLLGLSAYSAQQKTKEIGIRKVLGAKVSGILYMLNRELLKLIAIAAGIACPVSYILITKWLENFPYRMEPGPSVFILSLVIIIIIAIITVLVQAVKAALANPVRSLRYE